MKNVKFSLLLEILSRSFFVWSGIEVVTKTQAPPCQSKQDWQMRLSETNKEKHRIAQRAREDDF